jgi:uncharacterized protein
VRGAQRPSPSSGFVDSRKACETLATEGNMQTDDFEWDDSKAAKNVAKHGVSFEAATFAFDDDDAIDDFDETGSAGEDRFKWTGWDGQTLLVVIYALRANRRRIISARRADDHDRARYDQNRRSRRP